MKSGIRGNFGDFPDNQGCVVKFLEVVWWLDSLEAHYYSRGRAGCGKF